MHSILQDMTAGPALHASYLAKVTSVQDPDKRNRVQIRLLSFDGVGEQNGPVWARVAVPFAGSNRGAFLIPDVGDEVVVTFLNGDSRFPIVVGGLWNGKDAAPETLGGAGDEVDRWSIVGKKGTRIAIEEQASGQPTIRLTTPGNVSAEVTDSGGGKVEIKAGGCTITIDPTGISIQTGAKVQVKASQIDITAGQVNVNAAMSKFSGMVKCDVLQATTVIGTTYTPGVGNVW
ncbi:MAG: phage baseplate assembly protein V [Bryobacteraceae bacterium]|nr:phage baseplate assembly protein V [Bryobacteraceae bacterium]